MRNVIAKENAEVFLGRQGENGVTNVQFSVDGWREQYGEGTFELLHKRRSDTAAYPCVVTITYRTEAYTVETIDEETGEPIETTEEVQIPQYVNWVIVGSDVQFAGKGEAQLVYLVNGNVAKSVIFTTCVAKSLDGSGEVPPPYESRIQQMLEEAEYVHEQIDYVEEHAEDSEAWARGTRNGVDVPFTDETWHNNSRFYAELARQAAAQGGYMYLWVDDNGVLWLRRSATLVGEYDFRLTSDGVLEAITYGE